MNTYEIRKYVYAPNIVEAFNQDVQTPPEYIALINEGEEERHYGFIDSCKETTGSKGSKKKRRK